MKFIINVACTLDGKINVRERSAISDISDFNRVYELRSQADAILVGAQTIVDDDPSLTSHGKGPDPLPIILDRRGIIPHNARIHKKNPIIISSIKRNYQHEIITDDFSWVSIKKHLLPFNLKSVLVEGGGKVICSLIEEEAWDECYMYIRSCFAGNSSNLTPLVNGAVLQTKFTNVQNVKKVDNGILVHLQH